MQNTMQLNYLERSVKSKGLYCFYNGKWKEGEEKNNNYHRDVPKTMGTFRALSFSPGFSLSVSFFNGPFCEKL